jgi:hypothetical protein
MLLLYTASSGDCAGSIVPNELVAFLVAVGAEFRRLRALFGLFGSTLSRKQDRRYLNPLYESEPQVPSSRA